MRLEQAGNRRGGRDARRSVRRTISQTMLPQLKRSLPVVEPMSPEQVERVHNASMAILEDVGVDFRDPIALADWRKAGARVEGNRVYLDRGLVMELIATIPREITLHARDPGKSVTLGGNRSIFVPMTGAPYLRDLDDKAREEFSIGEDVKGVVVAGVDDSSVAAEKQVKAGEIIIQVGQEPVGSVEEVTTLIEDQKAKGRKVVLLALSNSDGDTRFVVLPVE